MPPLAPIPRRSVRIIGIVDDIVIGRATKVRRRRDILALSTLGLRN
jgi:hypothetical protein